jgi:transcription elongation GreA/GreB family factor
MLKRVGVNCEVLLKFADGSGKYIVRNPGCDSSEGFKIVSTAFPLGKAIFNKEEGELINFLNAKEEVVRVRIVKVFNKQVVCDIFH